MDNTEIAKKMEILPDRDLTETQLFVTTQTFDRYASKYAKEWEWNKKTIEEIKKYNIEPFSKHLEENETVLIVGSRSGRDFKLLSDQGFRCIGIEPSYGLITEALERVPNGLFVNQDLRVLPFLPGSFDAIYSDNLSIIPKRDVRDILKDYRIFLKPSGILYLSLKLGQSDVFVMNDLGGPRYMTMYEKETILEFVRGAGFSILWSEESTHTDLSLPRWFSLVAKKSD